VDPVRAIADAVLYEGYLLWPYRRSATKNQRRWTFGGVYPRAHSARHPDDRWTMRTECLLEGGPDARFTVSVRFLHVVARQALRGGEPVDELVAGGERHLSWDEATERELTPWYRATVALDRARLAEIDAIRTGADVPAIPADDVVARVRAALPLAMSRDADVFRAGLELSNCLALPQEVFARPGLAQRVLELAGDGGAPPPGPSREQVLRIVA
jgi:hypothetical protein